MVIVYGEMEMSESAVFEWKKDLSTIQEEGNENEEVRIVSGEAFCDLYYELKKDFLSAVENYGTKFKMIAGPIISVDEKTYSNAVLDLADDGLIDLWISPYRRLKHYRVFDYRFMYCEEYHETLSSERKGSRIRDLISISKYSSDFDNIISALKLPKHNEAEYMIRATKDSIREIKASFGELYDFAEATEVRSRAFDLGIVLT